ncbi:hypothetical protein WDV93_07630 [Pantoea ananatis]
MSPAQFLLSRHWRDTPQGTEITLWLATDEVLSALCCLCRNP